MYSGHSASGDNYYQGAAGLQMVYWYIKDSQGYVQWYVYWINIMNQPLAVYGKYLYADMNCVNPSSHQSIKVAPY